MVNEETNDAYAVAKLQGLKCVSHTKTIQNKLHMFNANKFYGPNDNYDIKTGHFYPAFIKKLYIAKKEGEFITIWGNGSAKRELMFVDDLADACEFF